MKPLAKTLLLSLFIVCSLHCYSQELLHFSTQNGLPSNTVYRVFEDYDGFIWILTDNGLVKYDGYEFKNFNTSNGMPLNDIWEVRITPENRIYFFGKNPTLGYIKDNEIHKLPSDSNIDGLYIYMFGNQIYAPTKGGDFFKANDDGWKYFTRWELQDSLVEKQKLFVSYNKDFKKMNLVFPDKILTFNHNYEPIDTITLKKPFRFQGRHWYTTYDQFTFVIFNTGVAIQNNETRELFTYSWQELGLPENSDKARVHKTPKGFQITKEDGIAFLDPSVKFINSMKIEIPSTVHHFQDSNGNIWSNSLTTGLYLERAKRSNQPKVLSTNFTEQIEMLDGKLYAGFREKGLFSSYGDSNWKLEIAMKPYSEDKRLIDPIYNYQLAPYKQSLHYANENGYFCVKPNEIELVELITTDKITNLNNVDRFKFFEDDNYFYTIERRFYGQFNKDKMPKELVSVFNPDLRLMDRFQLNDSIYFLSQFSIEQLKDNQFNTLVNIEVFKNSLSSVIAIGDIAFIGTSGNGVFLFDGQRASQIYSTIGMNINNMFLRNDELWLASTNGIHVLKLNDPEYLKSKIQDSYLKEDGLLEDNCNDLVIDQDTLIVGSSRGIVKINIKEARNSQLPKPYIQLVNPIDAKKHKAEISFGAIDFVNQKNLKFSYRLMPVDTIWQETKNRRLEFSSLPPNEYQFQLKVRDQHNKVSQTIMSFEILPKWYQTRFAKIMSVLLSLTLVLLIIYLVDLRSRRISQEKIDQEKRFSELQLAALRSQMNPHFVFNSLNSIQYFIEENQKSISQKYLSQFAVLMRQFLNNSRLDQIPITDEIDFLEHYLSLEKMRFEDGFDYSIICDQNLIDEHVEIPSLLIQPFVENAINHGIFHLKGKGHIIIQMKQDSNDIIEITIFDNGIGINQSQEMHSTPLLKKQAHSIDMIKERIELLNKKGIWTVNFSIRDRSEIQTNSGTIVQLFIKQNNIETGN